jgi:hypothetical protein
METIVFFLVFLLGIAAGYIWRDHISRTRHDRARVELRSERRQMGMLDSSIDGTYGPKGWPKE